MALNLSSGFLALAFMEASAAFLLLVFYALLAPMASGRFFRSWMAGWSVYLVWEATRLAAMWRGGMFTIRLTSPLSVLAAEVLFLAVLNLRRRRLPSRLLYPLATGIACALVALSSSVAGLGVARWVGYSLESALYICGAWILWASRRRQRGLGWQALAFTMLLRGLHGIDRPNWSTHEFGMMRASFHGLLGIAMGVSVAVLALEASRARTDELSEKLRRLALIAAEAMKSLRVDETLNGVLQHLVASLGASHGVVYLFDDPGESKGFGAARPCRPSGGAEPGITARTGRAALGIQGCEPAAGAYHLGVPI
jgi:hypothetical protein